MKYLIALTLVMAILFSGSVAFAAKGGIKGPPADRGGGGGGDDGGGDGRPPIAQPFL